jgi:2-dehydropantoate 2-reductase
MKKVKNVVFIGIGGVGGYFGGRIANKIQSVSNPEYSISFVAVGEHFEKVKQNGLVLNTSTENSIACKAALVTNNVMDVTEPDIIVVAVKSYDLDRVLKSIEPIVAENTVILPLMSGVDVYERVREIIKKGIVLQSSVYVTSEIVKPGVVTQKGNDGHILMGPDPKYKGYYPQFLAELFDLAGIAYEWNEAPEEEIWEKYMFVASYSMVTAAFDITAGDVFSDFNFEEITRQVITEIYNVGKAAGVNIYECAINDSLYRGRKFDHNTKTLYQRDIELNGAKNESNIFGEALLKMASEFSVDIPVIEGLQNTIQERIKKRNGAEKLVEA